MDKKRTDNLVLFTDTDTDITPAVAKEYGYNLISMPYSLSDGKDVYPYVDWDTFDEKTFYDKLRNGEIPKSCALSPEVYFNYFEPFFKDGKDILYVHFSKAMSGTFSAMNLALKDLAEKYPERKFYAIDTMGITLLSLGLVLEIGELYLENKTIEEILAWADVQVQKQAIFFYPDDLTFFGRSGRVGKLTAAMGNFIGLHPIIHMDSNGKMVSLCSVRGKIKALQKMVDLIKEIQEDILKHRVIIGHADCLDLAIQLEQMLKDEFGEELNVERVVVNPTIGGHCGPDCIGVTFHAKARYDTLHPEK